MNSENILIIKILLFEKFNILYSHCYKFSRFIIYINVLMIFCHVVTLLEKRNIEI